jgi:cyclophilin family peptidyl-prolyl cis-trans isomerase
LRIIEASARNMAQPREPAARLRARAIVAAPALAVVAARALAVVAAPALAMVAALALAMVAALALAIVAALALAGCGKRAPAPEEALGPPGPECALRGLDRGAVPFVLETSEGPVHCALDAGRAPRAAAMVVGLAAGRAPFRDAQSGRVVRRPYFTDMPFFRAIAGGMVQTGCPVGNGTGHPGYRLPVELDPTDAARLARPGALFLARYTLPPNRADPAPPPAGDVIGTQLVVGLTDMSHLTGKVTVLGACADLEVVRRIAAAVAGKHHRVALRSARVEGEGLPTDACPAAP